MATRNLLYRTGTTRLVRSPLVLIILLLSAPGLRAADGMADVVIKPTQVASGIYMLEGQGGNIAASIGADGTLIVDNQFAPLAERIQTALNGLGGSTPRLVINTHHHGDHTGSNAHFGRTGTIVSHVNVRERLTSDSAVTRAGWPLITLEDKLRLHFNDDIVDVLHLPAGHTDGDVLVWFRSANVVHMGDHFFVGRFPYIDYGSGGSVSGALANLETALLLLPSDISIIPGHGPLATVEDLAATINMYRQTMALVKTALDEGKTAEQIVADGLPAQWRSWGSGFVNTERWLQTLITALSPAP